MDLNDIKIQVEGGENMKDISELHPSELGEIIWQHESGLSNKFIAKKLNVKLWQVDNYIKDVKRLAT